MPHCKFNFNAYSIFDLDALSTVKHEQWGGNLLINIYSDFSIFIYFYFPNENNDEQAEHDGSTVSDRVHRLHRDPHPRHSGGYNVPSSMLPAGEQRNKQTLE